jgi:CDP-glucose 4,6-dehydratase
MNADFWRQKRVLLTGHTGFKGSWLSLWLQQMGANLQGYALPPNTQPNLFTLAKVADGMDSTIGDVRDFQAIKDVVNNFQPEIVIHMAAQPLVRQSYRDPVETYAINVMGTVHLLEALRGCASAKVVVNVTTDKVYENREWVWPYREDDQLGGYDPYSSSKACSELVTSAYRRSFLDSSGIAVASVRAGNVIGGGDWAADRLVPDVLRALERNVSVDIRNPHSTRPWQHVLEPLSGYLLLAESLWSKPAEYVGAWNFGPDQNDVRTVGWIVQQLHALWFGDCAWQYEGKNQAQKDIKHPHEAGSLSLDISMARRRLGWSPRWQLNVGLKMVTDWQRAYLGGADPGELCLSQLREFASVTK